jgi:DNA repair exonuclease SbcCD ATPase subunit
MLEKLQLKGFRLHKELEIEFSSTITTIIGRSFSGKSTIIRGLIWPMKNEPSGTSMINWDFEKAISRLFFDENKVTRIRSKSTNLYKLNNQKFVAFGNDVPSEIAKLLNISDINFQRQITMPFWFNETAGEVSRQLNKIVNLDVIDKTLSNIESKRRETKQYIELTKKRLQTVRETKEQFAYVLEMDEDLQKIEQLQQRQQKIIEQEERLSELIEKAELLKEITLKKIPDLNPLEILKEKYDKIHSKIIRLKNAIQTIVEKENNLCQTENSLKQSKELFKSVVEQMQNICPLLGGICPRGLKETS